jgi:hypothetical protein
MHNGAMCLGSLETASPAATPRLCSSQPIHPGTSGSEPPTEMNRISLVLFDTKYNIFGPYLAAIHGSVFVAACVRQIALHSLVLAFAVVSLTCGLLIPVMLYIFWLTGQGWRWYDAALFGSIIASTDAVAIVAVLKKGASHRAFRLRQRHSLAGAVVSVIFCDVVRGAGQWDISPQSCPFGSAPSFTWECSASLVWRCCSGEVELSNAGPRPEVLHHNVDFWGISPGIMASRTLSARAAFAPPPPAPPTWNAIHSKLQFLRASLTPAPSLAC